MNRSRMIVLAGWGCMLFFSYVSVSWAERGEYEIKKWTQLLEKTDLDLAMAVLEEMDEHNILAALMSRANAQNPETRKLTVLVLGEIGAKAAIPRLIQALDDENADVRAHAARALGIIGESGDRTVRSLLREALTHEPDSSVCAEIVDALIVLSDIDTLLQSLQDSDARVRQGSVTALGTIGDRAFVPALLEVFRSKAEQASVRRAAAEAIGKIAAVKPIESQDVIAALENVSRDNTEDESVRDGANDALARIGKGVSPLRRPERPRPERDYRSNSHPGSRFKLDDATLDFVKVVLEEMGANNILEALRRKAKAQNPEMRWRAVWALGEIGAKTVIPTLIQALEDENSGVRATAANALQGFRQSAVVAALRERLQHDPAADVRASAASALGASGDRTVQSLLREVLTHESEPSVCAEIVRAFVRLSDIDTLLQSLQDSDARIRQESVAALGTIGDRAFASDLLEVLQTDEYPEVRQAAAAALGTLGDRAFALTLLEVLQIDEYSEVRQAAAAALGTLGDRTFAPALIGVLKTDPQPEVRQAAAIALGTLGDRTFASDLLEVFRSKAEQASVRRVAAEAIGMIATVEPIESQNVIAVLENASRDTAEDESVRDGANYTLAIISGEWRPIRTDSPRPERDRRCIPWEQMSLPDLLDVLPDEKNSIVGGCMVRRLEKIVDSTAIPALVNVLHDDLVVVVESVARMLATFRETEALWSYFSETGNITVFNLLRHNLLFTKRLAEYHTLEDPFKQAAALYLLALQAREQRDYEQEYEYANMAFTRLDPKQDTALAILSSWLKVHAEIKLQRSQDALRTIRQTENFLRDLSVQEQRAYQDLFDEWTLFFKGRALAARGQQRQAIAAFEITLPKIAYKKDDYNRRTVEKLAVMVHANLGLVYIQAGEEQLKKSVKLGQSYQPVDSLEMESEEECYLELARYAIADGDYQGAQTLIEELALRRQKYLNRRLKLELADSSKQQVIDEYTHKQEQLEDISHQITKLKQARPQKQALQMAQYEVPQKTLTELEEQHSQTQRELASYVTKLKQTQPDLAALLGMKPIELKMVQERLAADTILLQYLVLPKKTIVFVINTETINIVEIPVAKEQLHLYVKQFRCAVGASACTEIGLEAFIDDPSPSSGTERGLERIEYGPTAHDILMKSSRALYDLLLLPIVERGYLAGMKRLCVSPNGILHYVPFEALHDSQNQYVNDTYSVFYINSTSILWVAMDRAEASIQRTTHLVAFGNPDGTLRYAQTEVEQIAALFANQTGRSVDVYYKNDAQKTTLKTVALRNSLLHIATHGIFNPENSPESYLVMADGRLTIQDIWGLPLRGLFLTTLSACQTGVGENLSGDDLISLENAFIYAGSPAVISTLWSVDDRATSELMTLFYRYLLQGMQRADALTQAKRDLGKRNEAYQDPYYWAAFILRGIGY
ncbi:MAG: CHAT domain-containing protein [bacterium]|nr:CHAT domain-containing protein [bacterium]